MIWKFNLQFQIYFLLLLVINLELINIYLYIGVQLVP